MKKNLTQLSATFVKAAFSLIGFLLLSSASSNAQVQTLQPVYTKVSNYIKGYYESLPVNYQSQPTKKFPVLIFIHGKGEMGDGSVTQLPKVANVGVARLIKQGKFPSSFTVNGEAHSFIVISPQITTNAYSQTGVFMGELLAHIKKTYRVDESRIYVTGLSMGGGMTWNAIGTQAASFAAAVPVCGSTGYTVDYGTQIVNNKVAVWCTHNSGDGTVSVDYSKRWYSKLISTNANPAPKMTIFEATSHDAWTKTYDPAFKENGMNVYEWMLSYKKGNSTPVVVAAPPVANAGTDQLITLPANVVTLNGSRSSSASGTITSYAWSKISGPVQGSITNSAAASTTVSNLAEGAYNFQLKVTDANGNSSFDSVMITVKAALLPPVADADADQIITLPVNSVMLNGSKSVAGSGAIKSYAWVKISGPTQGIIGSASTASTSITNLAEGVYTFQLKVTNSNDITATDEVVITVKPALLPPVANAGIDQTIELPSNTITLNGLQSTANSGIITNYQWSKIAGTTQAIIADSTAATTLVSDLTEGTYQFQLKVTDNNGNTSSSTMSVTVNAAPLPPVADAGVNQTITLPANGINLDGSKSFATADSIVSYKWTKTYGGAATIVNTDAIKTSVTGLSQGTYTFTLTITNRKQLSTSSSVNVIVNAASVNPISIAGADQTISLPNSSVIVNGNASKAATGRIISYKWTKVSGAAATIAQPAAATTSITGLAQGVYSFSLQVTSDNGKRSSDTVQITVSNGSITVPAEASADAPVQAPAPEVTNAPVSIAGSDKIIVLPTNTVSLNGSASKATTGRIISYTWSKVSGGAAIIDQPGSAITTVSGLVAGVYEFSLRVIADNGKRSTSTVKVTVNAVAASARTTSETVQIENIAAINALKVAATTELSLYPNPVVSDLNIKISSAALGKTNILIYDLSGKMLMQQQFNKTDAATIYKSFNLAQLPAGIYLVKVLIGNEVNEVSKIVKK